jgi:chitinase
MLFRIYFLLLFFNIALAKKIIGYYPEWKTDKLQISEIPWKYITHINYAFINVERNGSLNGYNKDVLHELSNEAKKNNVSTFISIGGWTYSTYFSDMVSNINSLNKVIKNLKIIIQENNLDGIDIDWEYPGEQGCSLNTYNINDTDNLLNLLKIYKKEIKNDISMSVNVKPWLNSNNTRINYKIDHIKYLNWINIMAYDINGNWSVSTGPNSPFKKGNNSVDTSSVEDSFNSWKKLGFKNNQINIGIPFYGRGLLTNKNPKIQYNNLINEIPRGDETDENSEDKCNNDIKSFSGL